MMKRVFLKICHATILTLLLVTVSVAQEETGSELADDEVKAELIKLTLERALIKKEIPDYNIIEKQDYFLLSTENISAELVPELKGVNLILLQPEEIQERAESKGDYVYYFRFKKFEVKDSKVFVALHNVPMYAKKPTRMAFGGGFTIEYQKQDGQWIGKIVDRWIV